MPEFTKSSVGSFAGTSELEGTMLCPFERKYSRNPERISFDFIRGFYCTAKKHPERGRPLRVIPPLCVDTPVFQEPGAYRAHGSLVRLRELLQGAAGIEPGEELAILLLGPGLAGFLRHLALAPLEALDALERACRLIKCPHHLRPLIDALRRKHFTAFRVHPVRQRPDHCQGLC